MLTLVNLTPLTFVSCNVALYSSTIINESSNPFASRSVSCHQTGFMESPLPHRQTLQDLGLTLSMLLTWKSFDFKNHVIKVMLQKHSGTLVCHLLQTLASERILIVNKKRFNI